jgi:hypothetical protein
MGMKKCLSWVLLSGGLFAFSAASSACELCAVYSADSARGNSSGFLLTIAEQYISSHTLYFEGEKAAADPFFQKAFLDSSLTHVVPGYNFSGLFGLSLNMPVIYREFRITSITPSFQIVDEAGTVFGLGDLALIGRFTPFQRIKMKSSISISLLAGIKFPTGDTARLDEEVAAARSDPGFFLPGHQHGAIGGIHQHDLTLGSGSYDGVFGITSGLRWKRWFLNNQAQYYLRTEANGYQFGDLIIVSGGPGAYLLLGGESTLSLQANVLYESTARDQILGQTFNHTGTTIWYFGPLINFTLGDHFSANAGVDFPLRIYNHGLQTLPDYRVHGGFTWRF